MKAMVAHSFPEDADIARLFDGFANCTLPKSQWTHAAHFAVALWMIARWPELEPERVLPAMIRRFNESVGGVNSDTEGYHETITLASLRAARAAMSNAQPDTPVHQVHADLMLGALGHSDWHFAYWSEPVLMSVDARKGWVEPNRTPLPF